MLLFKKDIKKVISQFFADWNDALSKLFIPNVVPCMLYFLHILFFAVLDGSSCVVSSSSTTTTTNTNSNNNTSTTNNSGKSTGTCEAHIPPLLGVAPLGPAQLTVEHELQFKMLQAAFFHMPHPSDSERLRLHLPRQPCQTPLYYPQVSGSNLPVRRNVIF